MFHFFLFYQVANNIHCEWQLVEMNARALAW